MAEPVHGSAPDIAGRGIANPIAAILSAVLLVCFVWQRLEVADRIEQAVVHVLQTKPELVVRKKTSTPELAQAILSKRRNEA